MAASIYKWLAISLFPLIFFYNGSAPLKADLFQLQGAPGNHQGGERDRSLHPFHVSVVEINHNANDKTLEISCKIFTDDFEKVLAQNYPQDAAHKTRVDLINPPVRKAMDTLVKNYISTHLSIRADGKPVHFSYLGFERESEAVYSYVQVDNIVTVKNIELVDKLMYDLFTDQINLIHVIVGGNRKSTKLDYPETVATISF
jgi:hypothetical protein